MTGHMLDFNALLKKWDEIFVRYDCASVVVLKTLHPSWQKICNSAKKEVSKYDDRYYEADSKIAADNYALGTENLAYIRNSHETRFIFIYAHDLEKEEILKFDYCQCFDQKGFVANDLGDADEWVCKLNLSFKSDNYGRTLKSADVRVKDRDKDCLYELLSKNGGEEIYEHIKSFKEILKSATDAYAKKAEDNIKNW